MTIHSLQQIDRALEYIHSGQVEEGLALLEEMTEDDYDHPVVPLELANVYYELGHVDTALSLLEKLKPLELLMTREMLLEASRLRAELLIDLGELDKAAEELMNGLEVEPNDIQASVLLADVYLMQNIPEGAIRLLESVLQIEPGQDDVRYVLSQIYAELGQMKDAEYHWQQLEGTAYEDKVILSKAKWFSQTGRFEEALGLYRDCLLYGESAEALFGCALNSFHLQELDDSIDYAQRLLAIEPLHVAGVQLLSEALERKGEREKARQILKHAHVLHKDEEAILRKLIEWAARDQDYESAMEYTDKLLQINSEDEWAAEWKERLARFNK